MKLFYNNSYNYYYISYYSAGDTLYKHCSGGTALCTRSIEWTSYKLRSGGNYIGKLLGKTDLYSDKMVYSLTFIDYSLYALIIY